MARVSVPGPVGASAPARFWECCVTASSIFALNAANRPPASPRLARWKATFWASRICRFLAWWEADAEDVLSVFRAAVQLVKS